jgi:uncharacterized membrane protein HdeD (DUF308 family)
MVLSICSPQFSLLIGVVALGLSMILWGIDKIKGSEKVRVFLGWLYLAIGLIVLVKHINYIIYLFFTHIINIIFQSFLNFSFSSIV